VPDFLPFRGLRFGSSGLDQVGAPPYDVIDPVERIALAERDPFNVIRLILPVAEPGDADEYARARADLDAWTNDGVLAVDPEPTFTVYRMSYLDHEGTARRTIGVLGALGLPDAHGEGDILPHERTIPKHRDDRLRLLRATRANLDPIWGLSLATGLREVLLPIAVREPDATATEHLADGTEVTHEAWVVTDDGPIDDIRKLVSSAPVVLADGHHRFQTACTFRDEVAGDAAAAHGADAILTLIVELDEVDLYVQPIERVVRGIDGPAVRTSLEEVATLTPLSTPAPDARGPVWIDRDGAFLLTATDESRRALEADEPQPIASTDAAWFEHAVAPLLGADADVTYRHDPARVARLVESGEADAVVLLRPVTVEQIRTAAIERLRFPQKSTFFAPKPLTGVVMRRLDDQPQSETN